jgi:hypothetical protein
MNGSKIRRRLIFLMILVVVGEVVLFSTQKFRKNRRSCDIPFARNLYFSGLEAFGLITFHSQVGQDRWVVEELFPAVKNGFFVDVGSADGIIDSNTKVLEDRGWAGICIDPFPTNMTKRRCTVSRSVVSSVSGERVSFLKAGELGGIEDYLGRWKSGIGQAERVEFVTTTLTEILRQSKAPHYINYMSIDIEGAELEALKGLDFSTYRIGSMTIEHNFEEPKRTQIRSLMESHGYRYARSIVQDDCFVLGDNGIVQSRN